MPCNYCGIRYGSGPDECSWYKATFKRGSDGKCTVCSKTEGDHYNHPNGNKYCYGLWRAGDYWDGCCLHHHDANVFQRRACPKCKASASVVEQFEQALPQKVSEASQAMKHFSSEHAACAKQYAVKFKRSTANVLLASETGGALRWLAKQCICASAASCDGCMHGLALCAFF